MLWEIYLQMACSLSTKFTQKKIPTKFQLYSMFRVKLACEKLGATNYTYSYKLMANTQWLIWAGGPFELHLTLPIYRHTQTAAWTKGRAKLYICMCVPPATWIWCIHSTCYGSSSEQSMTLHTNKPFINSVVITTTNEASAQLHKSLHPLHLE